MKTSRNFYQTILTIAIVLLSVVAFAQNTSDENPFTSKKFKTIRGDVNKSNPVEGINLDQANSGSGNVIESNFGSSEKLESNNEKSNDLPRRERLNVENDNELSLKDLRNYPNPFSTSTNISYEIGVHGMVNLSVYYHGMLVTVLVDRYLEAGEYNVVFEGMKLPKGSYQAVLTSYRDVTSINMNKVR